MAEIDRAEGRRAFGTDPAGYDRARPGYPSGVYGLLRDRCGLRPGTRTFEIGPGTGQATRHLLRLGAAPLVAVEPDERLAAFVASACGAAAGRIEVQVATFEDARLPCGWFDLGAAATALHWLDQAVALRKVAGALRPGGWWAMWWNVFGDPARHDAFHEATRGLLDRLDSRPPGSRPRLPFALDVDARLADLKSVGEFDDIAGDTIRWTAAFDTARLRGLYATFSPISRLPPAEQQRLLDALAGIADDQFGGRVERHMVTPVYTARRRSGDP
jgi:SAM-dependent methyltransferase